jgi:hypothetical protein
MVVRRGIRAVGEAVVVLGLVAQVVEDHARLDASEAPLRVDVEHPV